MFASPWSKFGRRKPLVVLVLIVIGAGWLHDLMRQQIIAMRFRNLGGKMEYHLGNVAVLSFWPKSDEFGDEEMRSTKRLKHLEQLYLKNTAVTQAGISHLANHPRLRLLSVRSDQITEQQERDLRERVAIEKPEDTNDGLGIDWEKFNAGSKSFVNE